MTPGAISFNKPSALSGLPPALFLPNENVAYRFYGFFTANIRNKYTRRADYKAACRGLFDLADVKALHVAAYVEVLGLEKLKGQGLSKPTVKQHLAALRMLVDWLVVGHVLGTSPTAGHW